MKNISLKPSELYILPVTVFGKLSYIPDGHCFEHEYKIMLFLGFQTNNNKYKFFYPENKIITFIGKENLLNNKHKITKLL